MRLTRTLHSFLNRVWSRDPKAVAALTISYPAGQLRWSVRNEVLTLTAVGGPGSSLAIDLRQYTLLTLTAFLAAQTGYVVIGLNSHMGSLCAIVLLDGEGDQSVGLQAYTSLRWAVLDAFARELHDAEAAAAAAPAQLSTTTAFGYWIDELGSYLGRIFRQIGEADAAYSARIPATILLPKGNNVAIAKAVEDVLGLADVTVTDVITYGPVDPAFNGVDTFDGAKNYDPEPTVLYGLFDVAGYAYSAQAQATTQTDIAALVEQFRAAGCHVRNIVVYQTLETDGPTVAPLLWDGAATAAPG